MRYLDKRMLSLKEVLKVRTQAHQTRQQRKKTKVSEGVDILLDAPEEEDEAEQNVGAYLRCLLTLMIAYSMAGIHPPKGAPTTTETKGDDTTKRVQCPLDIMMKYYFRVEDRARKMKGPKAAEQFAEHKHMPQRLLRT